MYRTTIIVVEYNSTRPPTYLIIALCTVFSLPSHTLTAAPNHLSHSSNVEPPPPVVSVVRFLPVLLRAGVSLPRSNSMRRPLVRLAHTQIAPLSSLSSLHVTHLISRSAPTHGQTSV